MKTGNTLDNKILPSRRKKSYHPKRKSKNVRIFVWNLSHKIRTMFEGMQWKRPWRFQQVLVMKKWSLACHIQISIYQWAMFWHFWQLDILDSWGDTTCYHRMFFFYRFILYEFHRKPHIIFATHNFCCTPQM